MSSNKMSPELIKIMHPDNFKAENICKKLIERIKQFEANLDEEHEIAIKLVQFGQTNIMCVRRIDCYNPDLIIFGGTINGADSALVQHVSQLNFLLIATEKQEPVRPASRVEIGFH